MSGILKKLNKDIFVEYDKAQITPTNFNGKEWGIKNNFHSNGNYVPINNSNNMYQEFNYETDATYNQFVIHIQAEFDMKDSGAKYILYDGAGDSPMQVRIDGGNEGYVTIKRNDNDISYIVGFSEDISKAEHITIVGDGTNTKIYFDGRLVGTQTGESTYYLGGEIEFGNRITGNDFQMYAKKFLMSFGDSITETEVAQLTAELNRKSISKTYTKNDVRERTSKPNNLKYADKYGIISGRTEYTTTDEQINNSNWKLYAGNAKIVTDNYGGEVVSDNLMEDGDMESAGTSAFDPYPTGTVTNLTKENSDLAGSSQCLRCTIKAGQSHSNLGFSINPSDEPFDNVNDNMPVKISGYIRGSDDASVKVKNAFRVYTSGSLGNWFNYNFQVSTEWQYFEFYGCANDIHKFTVYNSGSHSAGTYVEFDNMKIEKLKPNVKSIKAKADYTRVYIPTSYFDQGNNEAGEGEWNFVINQANQSNYARIGFIMNQKSINGSNIGYTVRCHNDTLRLVEEGVGSINSNVGIYKGSRYNTIKIKKDNNDMTIFLNGTQSGTGSDATSYSAKYVAVTLHEEDKLILADDKGNNGFYKK